MSERTPAFVLGGSGYVAGELLRLIAQHPELELVGLWVHSADKAGKDAGELGGIAPTGVLAISSVGSLCFRANNARSCCS